MKKILRVRTGNTYEQIVIETEGSLCFFKVGDIIRSDYDPKTDVSWAGKRFVVEGFSDIKMLWFTDIENGTATSFDCGIPNVAPKFVLLERPGWKFKVGDRVRCLSGGLGLTDKIGTIIVLSPNEHDPDPYLTEFQDWYSGHNSNPYWTDPWYPKQCKTPSISRSWCTDIQLNLEPAPPAAPTPSVERYQSVISASGAVWKIDTLGTRHGFRAGDVVHHPFMANHGWPSKKFLVLGRQKNNPLQLIVRSRDTEAIYYDNVIGRDSLPPGSAILLSRRGMKFKVGDEVVVVIFNLPCSGRIGTVIIMDPTENANRPYVIQIKGYTSGCSGSSDTNAYWFPRQLRDDRATDRVFLAEHEIEFARRPDTSAEQAIPAQEENHAPEEKPNVFLTVTVRSLFAELKTRAAKSEFPIFEPRLLGFENDKVIDFGKIELARNMQECLRKLGATLFHLITGESEFNHLKYEADPLENYEVRMPPGYEGELIRFLLFGQAKTLAAVEEQFTWLTVAAEEKPTAVVNKDSEPASFVASDAEAAAREIQANFAELDKELPADVHIAQPETAHEEEEILIFDETLDAEQEQQESENRMRLLAFDKLVAAGLNLELATMIVQEPDLAELMIKAARTRTN
ncbi:MAG: hypothetical protein WC654_07210 [Patescibacteria group bacterium]